jgi:asparagine synthase (glutamine-hydrolysing)
LARDRFGIKPLYYLLQTKLQFVFGSETIQFKYVQGYDRVADGPMVRYTIQNCWGIEGLGKTIFQGIEQVRPGHHITVKPNGQIHDTAWWTTADHLVEVPTNYTEQVEQFRALFEDALKLRLRSDVSIASALSGGLDSSSVFAGIHHLVSRNKNLYRLPSEWQRAFIAVFPGTEQDEREYAEAVLKLTGSEAVFFDPNTGHDLYKTITDSIAHYDTIYSTPLFILDGVYGSMRAHGITVSMDGHGVDEMMYGYAYNVQNALQWAQKTGNKLYEKDIRNTWIDMLPDVERERQLQFLNRYKGTRFIKRQLNKFLRTGQNNEADQLWFNRDHVRSDSIPTYKSPSNLTGTEAVLYDTFHYTTLPTILRNFDRGAMRNSIEIRMPFLDYRLVQYVFSLPIESKLGGGFTKRILRDAMRGILPEKIRTRKLKIGFNAPLQSWFNNELKEMIADEVSSRSFVESDFWNGAVVKEVVMKHLHAGKWTSAESYRFWPVLNAHLLLQHNQ